MGCRLRRDDAGGTNEMIGIVKSDTNYYFGPQSLLSVEGRMCKLEKLCSSSNAFVENFRGFDGGRSVVGNRSLSLSTRGCSRCYPIDMHFKRGDHEKKYLGRKIGVHLLDP